MLLRGDGCFATALFCWDGGTVSVVSGRSISPSMRADCRSVGIKSLKLGKTSLWALCGSLGNVAVLTAVGNRPIMVIVRLSIVLMFQSIFDRRVGFKRYC